jgi:transcriptional regulator with XRE-family HTH domain
VIAAQQLIRALRGPRSQLAFARRLGYRANPVTDWEHGRRYPTAQEALRIAERVGIDVVAALAHFAPGVALGGGPGNYALGGWMRTLLGQTKVSELARRMGRSRPTLSRWLCGSAQPRLHEFMEFIDATTGRLPDWVAELVPIEHVPALQSRFRVAQAARRLAFERPWTEGILRVLETDASQERSTHDPSWLSRVLGLPSEEVATCLEQLLEAQVITREGCKYAELRPLSVDTRGGRSALRAVKAHWARVAMERSVEPKPDDFFAYNLCSASREDMARIHEVLLNAFREIRTIVTASTALDEVALVNLHLVRWPVH